MPVQPDPVAEARRQATICNACRYCEGYCAVFPALQRARTLTDGDIMQLANLCHNCRGCYYACPYTAPHAFDLNLPRALANVQRDSWQAHAWPAGLARLFAHSGMAMVALLVPGFALLLACVQWLRPQDGAGFHAWMSHGLMVAIFTPAFLLPLLAIAVSLRRYWRRVGGGVPRWPDLRGALAAAGRMRYLEGGHGDGCNFEDGDRFSHARRHGHQATLYGFLLCFASTSSSTILHHGFGIVAPHGFFSLPKLLGVPGGLLLCLGTGSLAWLKTRADRAPGATGAWGGEMAFVVLLFMVSATGLALYAATGTAAVGLLLPVHLATVLTFFLLMPCSKMVHGFYRMAALTLEEGQKRRAGRCTPPAPPD